MSGGRPTLYSPEVTTRICTELMDGKSLRSICEADDLPECATIFNWLQKYPEFFEQYAQAREVQADLMADEICDIADDGSNDWMDRQSKDGETIRVVDHEHIQRSRLRVDARKWVASKLKPKKYGDRVSTEISGVDGGPVQTKVIVEFV